MVRSPNTNILIFLFPRGETGKLKDKRPLLFALPGSGESSRVGIARGHEVS